MAKLNWGAILVPGASALVGGAIGALLTVAALRDQGTEDGGRARPEPPLVPATQAPQASVDERLASIERSLRAQALKESVARAAAPVGTTAGDAQKAPLPDVAPIVDNPVFEAAVRDVMDRAEQERNVEREAQRAEWRKRTAEEWSASMGEKLRLTDTQKAKLTEIAQAFWERLRELRQADAGPPLSRQEWRAKAAELRKGSEAELAKVLDHAQLTSYGELDEAEKLGSPRSLRAAQRGGN